MKNEKIEIVFYENNKGFKVPLQTKSEAIEKMARAMCNDIDGLSCEKCAYNIYDYKDGCKEYIKQFLSLSKAALNVLLEDKQNV